MLYINEKMKTKLISFLLHNYGVNSNKLIDIITNNNLNLLLLDFIKTYDFNKYGINKILKYKQKEKNKVFKEEIERFIYQCEINNLEPIFLKGIFLATLLYDDIDDRLCNDIDILVKVEQFEVYKNILLGLGYSLEKFEHEEDTNVLLNELSQMHVVFKKKVKNIMIFYEIHGCIINPPVTFKNITQDFILDACKVNVLDLNVKILSIEYNLVFLMLHFFKHLPCEYFEQMIFKKNVFINISNLHDIALLLSIYNSQIDWSKVSSIAHKMNVTDYVIIVLKYVKQIYGEVVSDESVSVLINNANEVSYIASGHYEVFGLGKFSWLFDMLIDKIFDVPFIKILTGELPENINLVDFAFCQDKGILIKDVEEIILKDIYKISKGNKGEIDVELNVNVNKDCLKISINVLNKCCCCHIDTDDKWFFNKDSIEVIIVKPEYIVHRMFTICSRQDSNYIMMTSYNFDEGFRHILSEDYYELMIDDNGFTISLTIPWEELDISYDKNTIVPFNVTGLISDEETKELLYSCNLFNKDKYIWDFKDIGSISFV